ncbi:MAG TPA: GntR family transcriptional regulator [Candidatus Cloacimonadota bacterium]|nr:GntR family transcriptional regulator [Candidatus Cloacimonadota bacterium]
MKIFETNRPITEQLRKHIEDAILSGSLQGRIPSAREIAMNYKVNTVSVNETIRALLGDQILELERGTGICVSVLAKQIIQTRRKPVDREAEARPKSKPELSFTNPSKHLSWC